MPRELIQPIVEPNTIFDPTKHAVLKDGIPYVQFPIAFHTLDVIPFFFDHGDNMKPYFLFGRKPHENKFRSIGGFLDPGESAEDGGRRELIEEGNVVTANDAYTPFLPNPITDVTTVGGYVRHLHKLHYIGSFANDDPRFKDHVHKVSTSFYIMMVGQDEIEKFKAGDDIAEIRWYSREDLLNYDNFMPVHHQLIKALNERVLGQ